MISETITITNETGLHARPASVFVSTASKFSSEITIQTADKTINAKSILAVLSLGISKGTEIILSAEGSDEQEAINALLELARSNFNE